MADAFHHAGDHFAFPLLEFVVYVFAFCVFELLNDDLFGGLGRDTPEVFGFRRDLEAVTDTRLGIHALGFFDGHFPGIVGHAFYDFSNLVHLEDERGGIHFNDDFGLGMEALSRGTFKRRANGFQQLVAVDALLRLELL